MKKLRDLIQETAQLAAREWFLKQAHNPFLRLYAYFRKPQGEEAICKIVVSEDRPDGGEWDFVTLERLSPAWTEEQCRAKLIDYLSRNLPILNPEIEYTV